MDRAESHWRCIQNSKWHACDWEREPGCQLDLDLDWIGCCRRRQAAAPHAWSLAPVPRRLKALRSPKFEPPPGGHSLGVRYVAAAMPEPTLEYGRISDRAAAAYLQRLPRPVSLSRRGLGFVGVFLCWHLAAHEMSHVVRERRNRTFGRRGPFC